VLALLAQVEEAADARREDVPLLRGARRTVGGAAIGGFGGAAIGGFGGAAIGGRGCG